MHSKESLMSALQRLMEVLHKMPDDKAESGESMAEESSESPDQEGMEDALGSEKPMVKVAVKLKPKLDVMDQGDKLEEEPDQKMSLEDEMKKLKKSPNYMGKV